MTDQPNGERLGLYLYYIEERERIRLKRAAGEPQPWTDDPVLQTYRFTNIKRDHDRTTMLLNRHFYFPNSDASKKTILINAATFRYFGTFEFACAIGWQITFDPDRIKRTAKERMANKMPTFTAAYIITNNAIRAPKHEVVVDMWLTNLWNEADDVIAVLEKENTWQAVSERMRKIYGFGGSGFMTKEILLDCMLTPMMSGVSDKDTWSPAGPGGRKGLNYLYLRAPDTASADEAATLQEMINLQGIVNKHFEGHEFVPWLNVHDIQFSLCEYAKMMGVRGGGRAKRKYKPRIVIPSLLEK